MSLMDFVRRLVGSKPKAKLGARKPIADVPLDRSADEATVFRQVPVIEPEPEPVAAEPALAESASRGRPDQLTMMGVAPALPGDEAPAADAGGGSSEAATVYMQVPPEPEPEPPVRRQVATLSAVEGELEGQVFPVLEGENQIGRSPDSDVVLASRFVSRVHAKLLSSDGKISFVPVSEQLTLVNGNAATEAELKDGDKIQLGRTTLLLRVES